MTMRKEAKMAYKEAGTPMGVVQVKNLLNGKVLLEAAMNTDGVINRHRFSLKMNGHHERALQQDWNAQKPEDFAFEVLERLDPKDAGSDPRRALAALEARWLEALQPYGERGYHRPKR